MQSIGGMDTSGKQISHWWYTGYHPTFRGEATPGAPVNITIDGELIEIAANSDGNWVFTPAAALADGDHSIALESNGSTINFTLTLGPDNVNMDAIEKGGGDTLPAAGSFEITLIAGMLGLVLITAGKLRMWYIPR